MWMISNFLLSVFFNDPQNWDQYYKSIYNSFYLPHFSFFSHDPEHWHEQTDLETKDLTTIVHTLKTLQSIDMQILFLSVASSLRTRSTDMSKTNLKTIDCMTKV